MLHVKIKIPFSTLTEAKEAAKQTAIELSEDGPTDKYFYVAVNIDVSDTIRFFHFARIYGMLCERANKKVETPESLALFQRALSYSSAQQVQCVLSDLNT